MRFVSSVLLPALLALLLTGSAVLAYVFWSTSGIDNRTVERQRMMISQLLQRYETRIQYNLANLVIRDEAGYASGFPFRTAPDQIGLWLHELFGNSRTAVFDGNGNALQVVAGGKSVAPNEVELRAGPLRNLVQRVRTLPTQQADAPPPTISDTMVLDGYPVFAAAMPIASRLGIGDADPANSSVVVTVSRLDEAAAKRMDQDNMLEGGHFSLLENTDPEWAATPIINDAGRIVAFFNWRPDRPGFEILRQTGPVLLLGFSVAFGLVLLLLNQLRRSSAILEDGRRLAEYQANHDQLTGLPNRMAFDHHLAFALQEARKGAFLCLMMLDLDRFKQVNDTLGHQAGDKLIRAVAGRLRDMLGNVFIARLGGDEFGILLLDKHRARDAASLSEKIIDAIAEPFELGDFRIHVGVSIGIHNTVTTETEPHELIRKADIALYEAKAGGRNRACLYEEHMNDMLQLQHTIEGELREALQAHDQLFVMFQPLVDQQSGRVIGAEALARWNHPKFGQIPPGRFIPVAENRGLIEALGEFVLRRACALGATAPGRTIAVNISTTQLRNPRFADQVFDILHQTGMRPSDLELEITESILLDDEHVSSHNLRTFRSAGIQIALDDFGTGYSSLSYLKRYPVDRIKIDRSFVNQLERGHVSVAITQAIVTLAHAMNIEVTAEGVETDEQARLLGELGCNTLQGYLLGRPQESQRILQIFAEPANALIRRRRYRVA